MFRSYILSGICAAMALALIGYAIFFSPREKEGEEVEYEVAFNSESIGEKIIGKRVEEIAEAYLPPKEVSRKRRNTFQATYENVRIYTPGENTVVRSMTVDFADSLATAVQLGESSASFDAKILNTLPFLFKCIDAEIATREVTVHKGTATGFTKFLILVFGLLLLAVISFAGSFIVWPLLLVMLDRSKAIFAFFAGAVLIVAANWLYFGFLAYSQGGIKGFLIVGGIFAVIMIWKVFKEAFIEADDYSHLHAPSAPTQPSGPYVTSQLAMNHMRNLAMIIRIQSSAGVPPSQKRAEALVNVCQRLNLSSENFQYCLNNPQAGEIVVPSQAIREQFVKDIVNIVAADNPIPKESAAIGSMYASRLGVERDDYLRMIDEEGRRRLGTSPTIV